MNFDSLALAPAFLAVGESAVYTPPAGAAVPCQAIREGGGKPVSFGPITAHLHELRFDLRAAEVAAPETGAVLTVGGDSFTVTGEPFHPEDDSQGHIWCCPVTWGAPLVFRSVLGSGTAQNPPTGGPWTVGANAAAGATSINIRSTFTVGQLRPGDVAVIGGNSHSVTNTVTASSNVFTGVQITPALAASAVAGEAVTFHFARDFDVLGAIAGYEASTVMGGVAAGDRRVIVSQAALTAAGCTDAPKSGDKIMLEGKNFNVQSAAAVYQGAAPALWDIQAR